MKTTYPTDWSEATHPDTKGESIIETARRIVTALNAGEGGEAYRLLASARARVRYEDLANERPFKIRIEADMDTAQGDEVRLLMSTCDQSEANGENVASEPVPIDLAAPLVHPLQLATQARKWVDRGIKSGQDEGVQSGLSVATRWMTMPHKSQPWLGDMLTPATHEACPQESRELYEQLRVRDHVNERDKSLGRYLRAHNPAGREPQGKTQSAHRYANEVNTRFLDALTNNDTAAATALSDLGPTTANCRLKPATETTPTGFTKLQNAGHIETLMYNESGSVDRRIWIHCASEAAESPEGSLKLAAAAPLMNANELHEAMYKKLVAMSECATNEDHNDALETLIRAMTRWMPMPADNADKEAGDNARTARQLPLHTIHGHEEAGIAYERARAGALRLSRRELYEGRYLGCSRTPSTLHRLAAGEPT